LGRLSACVYSRLLPASTSPPLRSSSSERPSSGTMTASWTSPLVATAWQSCWAAAMEPSIARRMCPRPSDCFSHSGRPARTGIEDLLYVEANGSFLHNLVYVFYLEGDGSFMVPPGYSTRSQVRLAIIVEIRRDDRVSVEQGGDCLGLLEPNGEAMVWSGGISVSRDGTHSAVRNPSFDFDPHGCGPNSLRSKQSPHIQIHFCSNAYSSAIGASSS